MGSLIEGDGDAMVFGDGFVPETHDPWPTILHGTGGVYDPNNV